MQRFVLQQNLVRFQKLLAVETDERRLLTLRSMVWSMQGELALLSATPAGTGPAISPQDRSI
jgi:hypothetical protein